MRPSPHPISPRQSFVATSQRRGDEVRIRELKGRGITFAEGPAFRGFRLRFVPAIYPTHGVIPGEAGIHPDASPQPLMLWQGLRMDPGLRRGDTVFLA